MNSILPEKNTLNFCSMSQSKNWTASLVPKISGALSFSLLQPIPQTEYPIESKVSHCNNSLVIVQ